MSAVAIVGMGCRFAGAPDLQSYWKMTLEGVNAFGPPPPDRWDHEAFFSTSRRSTDKSYAPNGGFIEDIRSFPALHFGIPPRRVEVMDPQQRFAIEVGLQAIEDAGYKHTDMPRRTGVYLGVTASEYRELLASRVIAQLMASGQVGEAPEDVDALVKAVERVVPSRPFSAPGALANMIAAAVAQELDLHGPAYTTDAACASALMALSDAVSALRTGQVDAALAGGVYVCVTPSHHIAFSRIGAISAQGLCLPFDARADGFVQGDGAGIVVLKRLEDAQRDGDRIYAMITGVATNNDGRGDGPMAPVLDGQIDVIRDAWKDAGADQAHLGYVETHGTGTDVGDTTEFRGLQAALSGARRAALGSSKANVGHTMSAAGIAGVIRAALAVHHRTIPPMSGFQSAKEELGLDDSPFDIPTRARPWKDDARVACVSSFGFGGTNGHAVLTEAPDAADSVQTQVELVQLSASSESALREVAAATAAAMEREPRITVPGVARAWMVRPQLDARLAVTAGSRDELIEALSAYAEGRPVKGTAFGVREGTPKVALLFPGQGAQRVGMLSDVRKRFPVVGQTLDAMAEHLSEHVDLYGLLYPETSDDAAAERLTHTAHCQPVMYACGQALWALLQQIGLEPVVATGHSLGEFNAAVAGGVLSPAQGALYTARRGAAMGAVTGDTGSMAAIRADRATVEDLLVDGAVLANLNHPKQTVVSGTTPAVEQVVAAATEAGISATLLDVSHAFHSPIFDDLDGAALLDGIELSDPELPVASGIAERPYVGSTHAREVFVRHARSPVDFLGALNQCAEAGADLYLQVGAGGPLASFARKAVGRDARAVLTLASLDDADGGRSLLQTLGWLWVHGVDLDLAPITGEARVASVPPIPLPKELYWAIKDSKQKTLSIQASSNKSANRAPVEAEAAPAVEEESSGDAVFDKVVDVLARVSSYPKNAVQGTMRLVDDLGFDSLMVADLATGLADAFPGLGGLPQELLINQPTVQDIVDHVATAGRGGATEADDDAPLLAWTPTWRVTAPTDGIADVAGKPVLVVGDGPRATAIAAAFLGGGADVATCSEEEAASAEVARIVVWCAEGEPTDLSDVLSGDAEAPDLAGGLIAALDRQASLGSAPDLLLIRSASDPWAAGLSGAVRAVAREWPEATAKSLVIDGPSAVRVAEIALTELGSTDRTVDVKWTRDGRFTLGLEPTTALELPELGHGHTVAITGGTRGIGAKLAVRLAEQGARLLLIGRSDAMDPAAELVAAGKAEHVRCDVTDRDALVDALAPHQPIHALVHSAGVLADGPLGKVDPDRGALARTVKVEGWLNALTACGPELQVALGIGSWAGRFGNRHQAHYAAANAQLADLADRIGAPRAVVAEFGPWTSSEMVQTIPAAVRAAMRAEGVDFVGDEAGLDALLADLRHGHGIAVHGRRLPHTTRVREQTQTLSVETHPYLVDHAIDGTPVLPLAAAADLLAEIAGLDHPFEVRNLRVFSGVTVREPVELLARIDGDKAELRVGPKKRLAYSAEIRPAADLAPSAPLEGGNPIELGVERFYDEVTFHGPLLAGIASFDGAGPDFARGTVRTGTPREWIPGTDRQVWAVDPLALDSAFQLSAMVAWERYQRAGTPVSLGRLVQLKPWPARPVSVDVHFGDIDADRFSASFWIRDEDGELVAVAEDVVAELRQVESGEAFVAKPEWTDPSLWQEVKDLKLRLEGAEAMGIRNPFFAVHEGTARNTTQVAGVELINYSSYNYVGLSGDPRILDEVDAAVRKYGTSVSASRVASGERPFHGELEASLAKCQRTEDSLVFTAGHATNVTTIGHLFGPGDLVLHDELIHDSALQGIKLAGSGRRGFRHDDPDHLESLLKELRPHHEKVLIVVEGVYSMDGDICQLPAYIALKKKYAAMLMVDEAHSFGVVGATGCGVAEHFDIDGREVDIWMGTLSKSLASCGGWIAARKDLITYLRYTAPGFVYSAGLTPANGQAALSALRLMLEEPWRVEKLQDNARFFHAELTKRGLDTGPALGGSAVIPVVTGNSFHALMLSQRLVDAGINVQPIVYPAVADDAARLRFFLSSTHTHEQLEHTADTVAKTLQGVRSEFAI